MKVFYAILLIVILGGVGYASYQYGINRGLTPTINNTISPERNDIINNGVNLNDTVENPTDTTDTGTRLVAITAPKNGAIVVSDKPFTIAGTVSSDATSLRIKVYATGIKVCFDPGDGSVNCPDNPKPTERLVDDYVLGKFKPGDTTWSYIVSSQYDNAPSLNDTSGRFVMTATFKDGTSKSATVNVTYPPTAAEMAKPVVYLYPETTQAMKVNVQPTGGISYSEPVIGSGWNVTASPDGTLTDATGKAWPYLFWEGFATTFVTPKEGFVVAKAEVEKFFDAKLAALGLNVKETADFKEFWLPKFQDKPYYFVTFIPQATFDQYAPLTVSPAPDTVIRVFFDYKGLDKPMKVTEQILPKTPERVGSTVVEWGGRIYR